LRAPRPSHDEKAKEDDGGLCNFTVMKKAGKLRVEKRPKDVVTQNDRPEREQRSFAKQRNGPDRSTFNVCSTKWHPHMKSYV
jgi:hypothetical protein